MTIYTFFYYLKKYPVISLKQIKNLENGKIIKVTSNLNVTLVDANEDEREIFFNFPFILKREKQLERQRKRESMYR